MSLHQSSALSLASLITAATVLVVGYRAGRTHAAWREHRDVKRAVKATRRTAWRHTVVLTMGTAALVVTLAAAIF
ncbi:hypothetical protein [Actinoplanes sp. NPDC049265]|uniref:hypothetical protein n=1 Tax=Actinoplanes sp. NPDC049265 TaxID=3363902 RepID=UPI003718EA3B